MHLTFAHESSSLSGQIEKSKPSGIVSPKGIRDKWCNAATRQSW